MKRFALLIEASEVHGEDFLPGAKADADGYAKWLDSKGGGGWYASEVVVLHTPRIFEVKRALDAAGKVDYAFVAFSGHGFHSQELDLTKVCLRDGHMSVRELIPDTPRCAMVVDACRNVMPEVFTESVQLSLNKMLKYARFAEGRNYRRDFEVLVAKAEKGTIFLYSCDLDESAGDAPSGGYFTRSLLETGRAFSEGNEDGSNWLPTKGAFLRAAESTTGRNKQQHPQYQPGRRLEHFPFGV